MIEAFYFILLVKGVYAAALTQAGPFTSRSQCVSVREMAVRELDSFLASVKATDCYAGAIK
jgi:hypothetical protein